MGGRGKDHTFNLQFRNTDAYMYIWTEYRLIESQT